MGFQGEANTFRVKGAEKDQMRRWQGAASIASSFSMEGRCGAER
jgi:hypothetical protein